MSKKRSENKCKIIKMQFVKENSCTAANVLKKGENT